MSSVDLSEVDPSLAVAKSFFERVFDRIFDRSVASRPSVAQKCSRFELYRGTVALKCSPLEGFQGPVAQKCTPFERFRVQPSWNSAEISGLGASWGGLLRVLGPKMIPKMIPKGVAS